MWNVPEVVRVPFRLIVRLFVSRERETRCVTSARPLHRRRCTQAASTTRRVFVSTDQQYATKSNIFIIFILIVYGNLRLQNAPKG